MKSADILKLWLRERARDLRTVGDQSESAYGTGPMAEVCARIAGVHRRAAALYERELKAVEAEEAELARRET